MCYFYSVHNAIYISVFILPICLFSQHCIFWRTTRGAKWLRKWGNTELGKSRFTIVSMQNTEFSPVLLFIYYCVTFHTSNCKPMFASPCIKSDELILVKKPRGARLKRFLRSLLIRVINEGRWITIFLECNWFFAYNK